MVRGRRRCSEGGIDLESRPPLEVVREAAEKRRAAQMAKVGHRAEDEGQRWWRNRPRVGRRGRGNGGPVFRLRNEKAQNWMPRN